MSAEDKKYYAFDNEYGNGQKWHGRRVGVVKVFGDQAAQYNYIESNPRFHEWLDEDTAVEEMIDHIPFSVFEKNGLNTMDLVKFTLTTDEIIDLYMKTLDSMSTVAGAEGVALLRDRLDASIDPPTELAD